MFGRWGKVDLASLEHRHLLNHLCHGLEIEMEGYHRGVDQVMFHFYFAFHWKDLSDHDVCRECV